MRSKRRRANIWTQMLVCSWLYIGLCMATPSVYAAADVAVKVVAPAHDPGGVYLRQYLKDRGYSLSTQSGTKRLLVIALSGSDAMQLRYRAHKRTFRLPQGLKAPHTRARVIVSMVEMFLEETQHKRNTTPSLASPAPRRRPRRTRRRTNTSPSAPKSRIARPRQASLSSASGRIKGRTADATARPKAKTTVLASAGSPKAPAVTSPTPQPKAPARRALQPQKRDIAPKTAQAPKAPGPAKPAKPETRRPEQKSKTKPSGTKVARSTSSMSKATSPLAREPTLSWSLGLSGSARWGGYIHSSWGGALMVGMLWKDLALRLDASLLSFWLQEQQQIMPIIRSGLWAGWRLPLRRWTTRWEVYVLGGVILDPFVIEQVQGARAIWHLGLAGAAEGQWRINKRFSLFVRYSFSAYLIGYEPDAEGLDRKAYPAPTQNALQVGVQLRF